MRTRLVVGVALIIAAWCALAAPCRSESVMVVYSDGRPAEEVTVQDRNGKPYLVLSEVARLLRLERTLVPGSDKVTLSLQNHSLEIAAGASVWASDGAAVQVEDPALREGDDLAISLPAAEAVLAQTFGKSLRWDGERQRLMVGLPAPNVIDLAVTSAPEMVTATLKTVGLLKYDLVPAADNKLELLVRGGIFSRPMDYVSEGGLVQAIQVRQETEGVRVTVTLGDGPPAYRVFPQLDPDGIVVKVWAPVTGQIPEPALRPPRPLPLEERFREARAVLDVIVVDPGHGGTNRGSLGATGFLEKEFNLALARKLRAALEAQGIEVIMTRNDDIFVPIETRTEVANSTGADLFLSIHANGFANPSARGFEVYFLSPETDEQARYTAASENASASIEPPELLPESRDDVAFILWDTAQNEFVAESSYLAQLIDAEIARVVSIPNRGVKQAGFSVLEGAYLPGVLIETAFITNPQEEGLLRDAEFQDKVVNAVLAAILRFKQDYNR